MQVKRPGARFHSHRVAHMGDVCLHAHYNSLPTSPRPPRTHMTVLLALVSSAMGPVFGLHSQNSSWVCGRVVKAPASGYPAGDRRCIRKTHAVYACMCVGGAGRLTTAQRPQSVQSDLRAQSVQVCFVNRREFEPRRIQNLFWPLRPQEIYIYTYKKNRSHLRDGKNHRRTIPRDCE